jgi:hypothetical protein
VSIAAQILSDLKTKQLTPEMARSLVKDLEGKGDTGEVAAILALASAIEIEQALPRTTLFELVPPGWLRDYLSFHQLSEAPDSFHLFAGIALLTNALGKQMRYLVGTEFIYAPLSIFIISPAGQARRGDVIRGVKAIAAQAGLSTLNGAVTPEGLVNHMEGEPHTLLLAEEAAALLSKVEYMKDMPRLLCELIDMTPVDRKLKGERINIPNPVFSCILSCAPSWITDAMPKTAVGGGLFSRVVLVVEDARQRLHPFPYKLATAEAVVNMQMKLGRDLRDAVDQSAGQLTWSTEAEKVWEDFYNDNDRSMRSADDKKAIYYARKPVHVIKMVMGLTASAGLGMECSEGTLETALALLRMVEERMDSIYVGAGMDQVGQRRARVLKIIEKSGGRIQRWQLTKKAGDFVVADDLERILTQLIEERTLKVTATIAGGKVVKWYEVQR